MALITQLSHADAAALLRAWGIELGELIPLAAGSVNSNFAIRAQDGTRYFARIYEEQGADGARFELTLNESLAASGVPVARPKRKLDGEAYALVGAKPFAVYEHVVGEVLCQGRVTESAAGQVGGALARVHRADLGGLTVPEGRFGFRGIEERLGIVESSGRTDLSAAAARVSALAARLERERDTSLPSGLTHGDLFRDNVLFRLPTPGQSTGEGAVLGALLDFESACYGPYAYDLMVTLLAWCFGSELDARLARAMVSGYHAVRPLSAAEQRALVLEGSIACARFATTRMTDFSLRTPPGQAPARHYGRFFQRLEALESGALDSALSGVFQGAP